MILARVLLHPGDFVSVVAGLVELAAVLRRRPRRHSGGSGAALRAGARAVALVGLGAARPRDGRERQHGGRSRPSAARLLRGRPVTEPAAIAAVVPVQQVQEAPERDQEQDADQPALAREDPKSWSGVRARSARQDISKAPWPQIDREDQGYTSLSSSEGVMDVA